MTLLQNEPRPYYKTQQVLQNAIGKQNELILYYKTRYILQNEPFLSQNAPDITIRGDDFITQHNTYL